MKIKRLGDYIEITNGFAFKSSEYCEKGARIIRITNVQKGEIKDNDPKFYPINKTDNLNKYRIFENDILMSLTGNVGRVGRFPTDLLPAYINQRICRVKSISNELFDDYLYHILNSDKFELEAIKASNGIAQLNLSTKWIEDFQIPLPPLLEQKRIAEILDKADALRQKNKQLLATYDELLQSTFLDMFGDPVMNPKGWKKEELSEVIKIKHGYAFKSKYFSNEGDFILLTPGNFNEQGGFREQKKQKYYIGDFPHDYILKPQDLLLAMTEPAVGLLGSALFVPNKGVYLHNQRLGLVKYLIEINPTFLYFIFNHPSTREQIQKGATGTKVRHTSPGRIVQIKTLLPPIALQNQFAQIVENIEAQKALVKQSLQQSEDLFNGLVQEAFKMS